MDTPAALARAGPPDMTRLDGAWRLVTIEEPDASGNLKSASSEGLLVFTADGHMAVQVRKLGAAEVDSPYSRGGYEATYGTVTLDPAGSTFVYRVEGALVSSLVGQDLPRRFRFEEDRLIITSTRPDEKWRVVWRRR